MSLLQGVELYSTSVTPNNPNLQFDAQVTGSLQSKYDAGYNRASILYGSIINPDLTRQDTQKAKEEYLKMVDRDLKRVGAIDWSVSENINTAESLFKGMWTNELLKKDAIWTKTYMNEMNKAEGFKNCLDPAKCGGQYWDEGVKYMNYKRQEFMNADTNTALGFENATYVPYNSVMTDAIAKLKAANLSVKYDKVESGYIVTTKNGERLRSPLTLLFNETVGKDPKFIEMFKVKSYVDRKDWVSSKMQTGEYANESEANLNYLNAVNNQTIKNLNEQAFALGVDRDYLDQSITDLRMKLETGVIQPGTEMHQKLLEMEALKSNADNALGFVSQLQKIAQNKNKAALNVMVEAFDNENAFNYFNNEITQAVNTLMYQDYEQTLKEDPYSKAEFDFNLDMKKIAVEQANRISLEKLKHQNTMEVEEFKAAENPNDGEGTDLKKENKLTAAINDVTNFSINEEARKIYEDKMLKKGANVSEGDYEKSRSEGKKEALAAYNQAQLNLIEKKVKANTESINAGGKHKYLEVLHPSQFLGLTPEEQILASSAVEKVINKSITLENKAKVIAAITDPKNADFTLQRIVYNALN